MSASLIEAFYESVCDRFAQAMPDIAEKMLPMFYVHQEGFMVLGMFVPLEKHQYHKFQEQFSRLVFLAERLNLSLITIIIDWETWNLEEPERTDVLTNEFYKRLDEADAMRYKPQGSHENYYYPNLDDPSRYYRDKFNPDWD